MQELRKLNDNTMIVPKMNIRGIPVVFTKQAGATLGNQCRFCKYANEAGLCPNYKTQDGLTELYCNLDYEAIWQVDPAVKQPIESLAKPLEASVGRKDDSGKPMYSLLPPDALNEVVKVLTAGALRYNEPIDQANWRLVDNPQFRYFNAAQRHQWANLRGEDIDIDKVNKDGSISKGTDCYHLACAIASLMFMLQLKMEGNTNE